MPTQQPITQFPRSERSIFSQQSATPTVTQPRSGVWQDKPHPPTARTDSTQPAPRKKVMRPHQMNNNTSRSQNRTIPKRKTVHLTLWVKPIVKAELERRAAREGISVSATGGAFLEKALQADIDMQYGALLQPIIEHALAKHMRAYSTRLAVLLVRVAFASEQTRSLVTNILARQPGVSPTVLNDILDGSSKAAKGKITYKTPQLADLIEEVEQWFRERETGQRG